MMPKKIQAKHVPDLPVLKFLKSMGDQWATNGPLEFAHSVLHAMPPEIPRKVAVAKMASLIKRGLVNGCPCGCRGDYHLTAAGEEFLRKTEAA